MVGLKYMLEYNTYSSFIQNTTQESLGYFSFLNAHVLLVDVLVFPGNLLTPLDKDGYL